MFGQVVMQVNGKTISLYITVYLLMVVQHYSNAKQLLAKYTQHLTDVIRHPHKLLLVHIQQLLNFVHALLTIQAVRHGKVRLTAQMVSMVNQCLVVGSRLLTPVRLPHHHALPIQNQKLKVALLIFQVKKHIKKLTYALTHTVAPYKVNGY
jgi:hypothetical protein